MFLLRRRPTRSGTNAARPEIFFLRPRFVQVVQIVALQRSTAGEAVLAKP
jgi:hypothetical protein